MTLLLLLRWNMLIDIGIIVLQVPWRRKLGVVRIVLVVAPGGNFILFFTVLHRHDIAGGRLGLIIIILTASRIIEQAP